MIIREIRRFDRDEYRRILPLDPHPQYEKDGRTETSYKQSDPQKSVMILFYKNKNKNKASSTVRLGVGIRKETSPVINQFSLHRGRCGRRIYYHIAPSILAFRIGSGRTHRRRRRHQQVRN